jgi:hypothetical protein
MATAFGTSVAALSHCKARNSTSETTSSQQQHMTKARAMTRSRKRESREIYFLRTSSQVRLQAMIKVERAIIRGEDHVALLTCTPSFQNHAWRERVAQWCYNVVDHLDVPSDVVYLAMNILDNASLRVGMLAPWTSFS